LISKEELTVEEIINRNLPVGIPGANTTANLLLGYFAPEIQHKKEFIFDEIMPAILEDKVAAGVIIHENRFTYQKMGLQLLLRESEGRFVLPNAPLNPESIGVPSSDR
ncbi:MAG: MqnA/MqnD/SBP family protein, partial [Bacteroidota bacterium]